MKSIVIMVVGLIFLGCPTLVGSPTSSESEKDITSFVFSSSLNSAAGITDDSIGIIVGSSISVSVPSGSNVTDLIPTFSITGISMKIGDIIKLSGTTINNFSGSVTFTVTAEDGVFSL